MTTRRPTGPRGEGADPAVPGGACAHPRVERKLGELARWHDGRQARYWGRAKVLIQELLIGFVVNVKRMLKLMESAGAAPAGQCAPA